MRRRVLAAAMDLFCSYRGRLLPERYAFCDLLVRKTSFFVLKVSFSMLKQSPTDFEPTPDCSNCSTTPSIGTYACRMSSRCFSRINMTNLMRSKVTKATLHEIGFPVQFPKCLFLSNVSKMRFIILPMNPSEFDLKSICPLCLHCRKSLVVNFCLREIHTLTRYQE